MIQPPCKNCDSRCIGCHATCVLYANFNTELRRNKELVKQGKLYNMYRMTRVKANKYLEC